MNKIVQHYIDEMNFKEHVLIPDGLSYVDKNPLHIDYEKTKKDLYTWFETQLNVNGGIFTELDYLDYEFYLHTGRWEEHDFCDKDQVHIWLYSSYGWDDPLNMFTWERRKVFCWAEPIWCIVLPPPEKLKDAKTYKEYLVDLFEKRIQKLSSEEKQLAEKLNAINNSTDAELIDFNATRHR